MQMTDAGRNGWLNREADQLEAALASLAVPIRVSGGRLEEGRVRYHATAVGGVAAEDLRALGPGVATVLGADRVDIHPDRGGVTIDVSPAPAGPLRLLPLLSSLHSYPAITAVAGIDLRGVPLFLNLLHQRTTHLVVEVENASQRSAWLRSLIAGLAMGSRPSELQILGVDLTGMEQAFIEALPHALADVAFRADTAIDLLAWLRDETERRRTPEQQTPHLVMVVDDLGDLARQTGRAALSLINRLLLQGPRAGVHLLAGCAQLGAPELDGLRWPECGARATAAWIDGAGLASGEFEIVADGHRYAIRPAELPVVDLDLVVRRLQGPHLPVGSEAGVR